VLALLAVRALESGRPAEALAMLDGARELAALLAADRPLRDDPEARALFYRADGSAHPAGHVLRMPALAATLRRIAAEGASAFYQGPIAQEIVRAVASHPRRPGDMTLDDLTGYRVAEREAVCGPYRSFTLCGMGPPSSGGIAVLQMLAFLEGRDLRRLGPSAEAVHWFAEAGRLAFADRNLYLGDPDHVPVPVRGLLDRGYLEARAALMMPDRSLGVARAGEPPFRRSGALGISEAVEDGTSHISVVDAEGNAVAMTTTIESGFGARILTRAGFLLNNQLTDFDFRPEIDGRPVANRVEAGKRPRSSMAPMIVTGPDGRLVAVVGAAGGSLIIGYVARTLVALLDWGIDPQRAVDMGHFGSRNGPTELEAGTEAEAFAPDLRRRGHEVRAIEMTSGLTAIVVTAAGLQGGADGRREGVAIGD